MAVYLGNALLETKAIVVEELHEVEGLVPIIWVAVTEHIDHRNATSWNGCISTHSGQELLREPTPPAVALAHKLLNLLLCERTAILLAILLCEFALEYVAVLENSAPKNNLLHRSKGQRCVVEIPNSEQLAEVMQRGQLGFEAALGLRARNLRIGHSMLLAEPILHILVGHRSAATTLKQVSHYSFAVMGIKPVQVLALSGPAGTIELVQDTKLLVEQGMPREHGLAK